jgi:hypothetical protein
MMVSQFILLDTATSVSYAVGMDISRTLSEVQNEEEFLHPELG